MSTKNLVSLTGLQPRYEAGHYFEILSGGPVDIYFYGPNNEELAIELGVSAGYYLDRRGLDKNGRPLTGFDRFDIDFGGGAQTLKYFVTDGTGGQKSASTQTTSTVGAAGTHVDSAVVAGAASALLLAANAARKYLMVQVDSGQPAGIRIRTDGGVAADAAGSIEILPGQSYVPSVAPVGLINAIRKGGVNINVTVVEGT